MTAFSAPSMLRSTTDAPLMTELPAGTTDRDYCKFYWCMSAVEFYAALDRLNAVSA